MARMLPLLVSLVLASSTAFAGIDLDSHYSDGMVLQRNKMTRIHGRAAPGADVKLKYSGTEQVSKSDAAGVFSFELKPTQVVSGADLLITSGSDSLTLKNVAVGEVIFCSGQSNMQWIFKNTVHMAQLESFVNPDVRMISVLQRAAEAPVAAPITSPWLVADQKNIPLFSAVCFMAGYTLQKKLGVPVGLIHSSYGGTLIESWLPAEFYASLPKPMDFPGMDLSQPVYRPSTLFNAMVAGLKDHAVSADIWYQGESNAQRLHTKERYEFLLESYFKYYRKFWGDESVHFAVVQLANFESDNHTGKLESFAVIRDAQASATNATANTSLASAVDLGNPADIHPREKLEISRRVAGQILSHVYGSRLNSMNPELSSHVKKEKAVTLGFSGCYSGLKLRNPSAGIEGFELEKHDGVVMPLQASISENCEVTVHVPHLVSTNAYLRYAYRNNPVGMNLYNSSGLPVLPFRVHVK